MLQSEQNQYDQLEQYDYYMFDHDDNMVDNMAYEYVGTKPCMTVYSDKIFDMINQSMEKTKLYSYLGDNSDNEKLHNIMYANSTPITMPRTLFQCYKSIIENNMMDIVHSIIDGSTSGDELVIFNYAINAKRYDLLDLLIDSGFDLNKNINGYTVLLMHLAYLNTHNSQEDCGFDVDMCKYLVCKGADIMVNNKDKIGSTMKLLARSNKKELLNYLLDCITDPDILYQVMIGCNTKIATKTNTKAGIKITEPFNPANDFDLIKKIVDTGILYNLDNKQLSELIRTLGRYSPSNIEHMLNNGLQLENNNILMPAIKANNTELVNFLINYGLTIDENIVWHIFTQCPSYISYLLQYDIDYSKINEKISSEELPIVNKFCDKGLSKDSLLKLLAYKLPEL